MKPLEANIGQGVKKLAKEIRLKRVSCFHTLEEGYSSQSLGDDSTLAEESTFLSRRDKLDYRLSELSCELQGD